MHVIIVCVQVDEISEELKTLPKRVQLAAAFITYLSATPEDQRRATLHSWMEHAGLQSNTHTHKQQILDRVCILHGLHYSVSLSLFFLVWCVYTHRHTPALSWLLTFVCMFSCCCLARVAFLTHHSKKIHQLELESKTSSFSFLLHSSTEPSLMKVCARTSLHFHWHTCVWVWPSHESLLLCIFTED